MALNRSVACVVGFLVSISSAFAGRDVGFSESGPGLNSTDGGTPVVAEKTLAELKPTGGWAVFRNPTQKVKSLEIAPGLGMPILGISKADTLVGGYLLLTLGVDKGGDRVADYTISVRYFSSKALVSALSDLRAGKSIDLSGCVSESELYHHEEATFSSQPGFDVTRVTTAYTLKQECDGLRGALVDKPTLLINPKAFSEFDLRATPVVREDVKTFRTRVVSKDSVTP